MSSLVRRLQIRMMKARGYRRTNYAIRKDIDGQLRPVQVPRGGLILDPNDKPIGYHWPRTVGEGIGG
ncbi:hypothetical protein [Alteraurantiacibacter palmitatis]|uniref:DUF4224 domain-containing protein n=1 Tax=Alteraurantiacibacter palmitatis TaxID=2054628 RepID=A0ABV7E7F2_9SPHN